MKKDDFGDRMKDHEGRETKATFFPELPVIARMDGRGFSKFTKPFLRPFDIRLSTAMRNTTMRLVESTHACIGYTQSDEITLIFPGIDRSSQRFFGGKKQKLVSVLSSMTTAFFIRELDAALRQSGDADLIDRMAAAVPQFDARVWQVPSPTEATNALLWRVQDARKNGISSACRSMFSAASMHKKSQLDMVEMMQSVGVDYYREFSQDDRYGTFWQRESYTAELDDETWDKIPKNRRPPSREVTRSRVKQIEMSGYFGYCDNRNSVVFSGTKPQFS